MKQKQAKKKSVFTIALALTLCLATLISSLAIFRDYESLTINQHTTVGSMDLVFTDLSNFKNKVGDVDAISKVWNNNSLVTNNSVLISGSGIDISYQLQNTGTIASDLRQRICITSTVAFDPDNQVIHLKYYSDTFATGSDKTVEPFTGTEITPTYSTDNKTMYFTIADVTLNGTNEQGYDSDTSVQRLCFFYEDDTSTQQGAALTLNLQAQSKQHRNTTSSDFVAWENLTSITQIATD